MSTTEEAAKVEETQPKIEEHVHGENCAHNHEHGHEHGHEDDSDSDDGVTDPNKKSSRAEKKFKKAMVKLGLKPLTGINRVTVKKGKEFMVSIDNPEILKSENTYVVFGKVNMDDGFRGGSEIDKIQPTIPTEKTEAPTKTEGAAEESNEILDETGISPDNITMVIEYTKCTRAEAIRALRKTNDDSVNAIMQINKE